MADLPTGTVTFLFTDIEGSTRLWEEHPEAMQAALARHDALAAAVIARHEGLLVKHRGEGDSLFAVFPRPSDAVEAAAALQLALLAEPWPAATPLRARVALHTGEADLRAGDYYGPAVNRCARLRAAAHGGQVLLSQATFELVRDALPPDVTLLPLGSHRLKDLQRPEQVFQLLHPDLPADFPALNSLDARRHNLPTQSTLFIGREQEMETVKDLLGVGQAVSLPGASGRQANSLPHSRLLTLTGSGGTGKTRLALQVAAELTDGYPEGVWLVELASLADPALVPQAVAAVLRVREEPGLPLIASLTDALRSRSLLLLLDNCEHLVTACAALAATLLRECPQVRLLATSREALGVAGERVWRVPSLSLPELGVQAGSTRFAGTPSGVQGEADPSDLSARTPDRLIARTPERLMQYESVRLFIDRAVASVPEFTVTNANAPAVAEICARLDGIPLAIELAAARVRFLPVEEIAARLDDRFQLLTGGPREVRPRQQTLRAAMDWSYELLTEPERLLLQRLSVFAGGFTRATVEEVCARPGLDPREIVGLLGNLADKSLLALEEGEEKRYRLLETVRQYAAEHLREAGETPLFRTRHRDWYLALAEEAASEMEGPRQAEWLARLDEEHDNLRTALAWSASQVEAERSPGRGWLRILPGALGRVARAASIGDGLAAGLRLGGTLEPFWLVRGNWAEGREWLTGLLEVAGTAPVRRSPKQRYTGAIGRWTVALRVLVTRMRDALVTSGAAPPVLSVAPRQAWYASLPGVAAFVGVYVLAKRTHLTLKLLSSWSPMLEMGFLWLLYVRARCSHYAWNRRVSSRLRTLKSASALQGDANRDPSDSRRRFGNLIDLSMDRFDAWFLLLGSAGWLMMLADQVHFVQMHPQLISPAGSFFRLGGPILAAAVIGAGFLAGFLTRLVVRRGSNRIGAVARALKGAGQLAEAQGDDAAATALFGESLILYQQSRSAADITGLLNSLATTALRRGRSAEAQGIYAGSLGYWLVQGRRHGIARALFNLGGVALQQKNTDSAKTLLQESLEIRAELGDKGGMAASLYELGRLAFVQGDCEEAAIRWRESLALRRDLGDKRGIAECLEGLAAVFASQGEPARAARLFGAAEAIRDAMGLPIRLEDSECPESVAATRAALGEAAFAAAWAEGREMPLEEAVQHALAEGACG